MEGALKTIRRALLSDRFFVAVMMLFVLEAVWIAATATYPQPFDENTHYGLIKIYAEHWHPFISQPDTGQYGAVATNPSYLYHYLLSFPYRFFHIFLRQPATIIFLLRLINIAIFAASLVLFRKVLKRTGASNGLVNISLLFFVLVPVVPLLAGQLNYDSLLMLFSAGFLLLCLRLLEKLKRNELDARLLLQLLSTGLLGCLVQYQFLPFLAAGLIWLVYKVLINVKKIRLRSGAHLLITGAIFTCSLGLFVQRYGLNLARYGTPLPKCDRVLTVKECSQYSTWRRGHEASLHPLSSSHNPLIYTKSWLARMFATSFYVRSGGSPGAKYTNVGPYPIVSVAAIVTFGAGATLFARRARTILQEHQNLVFLLFVSLFYIVVLWLHLYSNYLVTGQKYALNGRYLFPVILPVMLAVGLGFNSLLKANQYLKPALFALVFILFLQGGGILTYINASNRHWYWTDNRFSLKINQTAQKITRPLIITHF